MLFPGEFTSSPGCMHLSWLLGGFVVWAADFVCCEVPYLGSGAGVSANVVGLTTSSPDPFLHALIMWPVIPQESHTLVQPMHMIPISDPTIDISFFLSALDFCNSPV